MAPTELALQNGQSSPRTRRSQSISSDRPSLTGFGGLLSPPVSVSPDPAFIAASAASQIVTNDHDSQADAWLDQHGIEPSGETAMVAPPALKLVNRFLDQLLFNFLSVSRSTSLTSLRPAVVEVLKPKLAKDAINGADQELNEYLGGGEDEELVAFQNALEQNNDWDLELVWKRTRLRCMVYSSLGDMEEEDEDYYTEQEHLDGPPGSSNRFSNNPGVVSPAVAIFLTSILEFMGEQVLIIAGQAAYHRLRARHEREEREGASTPADIAERVIVEEADMERVALDRTLGRLWRGWKKRIRSPTTSMSMAPRPFSRESMHSLPQTSRAASIAPPEENLEDSAPEPSVATCLNVDEHAATIPLPLNEDDVREIEIPGLAKVIFDGEKTEDLPQEVETTPERPKSLIFFHRFSGECIPSASFHPPMVVPLPISRKRRNSEPSRDPLPYMSPSSKRSKPSNESEDEEDLAKIVQGPESESVNKSEEKKAEDESEDETNNDKGLVAGIVAGAVAIGAAAVAGIITAAHGDAAQTSLGDGLEEKEEDFTEEPQILTSHRVSVGGRVSPDDTPQPSKRNSVRSPSVHSVRVIDVASTRSRHNSVNTPDYVSTPLVASRPSSVHTPTLSDLQNIRVNSPVSRGANSSPVPRVGSALSSRHTRNNAGHSISEVEEKPADLKEVVAKQPGKEEIKPEEVHEDDSAPSTPASVASAAALAGAMQGIDVNMGSVMAHGPSSTESKDVKQLGSTFLLDSPPRPKKTQESIQLPSTVQVSHPVSKVTILPKTPDTEVSPPPLTPLREIMEGAPDTSDESGFIVASSMPQARRGSEQRSLRAQPINNSRGSPGRSSREDIGKISQRSIHTSGSGSSSTSHKLKPVRTSEESTTNGIGNKSQSFEQLIQSDQTIQYTLTPQNMRDIEAPESPRNIVQDLRPATSRSQASSLGKFAGLHSNPPTESPKTSRSAKPFKPVPRPSSNTGARLRANAPQPRDARVDRDSIGDFAEFIRSTGPTTAYEPLPPRTASSQRSANGMRNVSGPAPRVPPPVSTPPRRTNSSAGRAKLQARDAVVSRGDSISDLIDFVRSGPQLDKEDHRISRAVAPFRSTMDSDQMAGAVGGKAIDATLPDPRYSQASASVTSSFNSQTPLINGSSKNKPLPTQSKRIDFEEEDRMPKRKTRRVRDPYAIDISDEEEEYEAHSKPKPIQEESLADFLRNVPPPPDNSTPVPLVNPSSIKKKNSTPGLMSRFGRNGLPSPTSPNPISTRQDSRPAPVSKTAPGYTPIAAKVSSTTSTYGQDRGTGYVSQLDSARNKVPMKSYQPREAAYSGSRTNDLAEFLMRSEPPSAMQTQPQTFTPTVQKEEASTFQRMFGRKKV